MDSGLPDVANHAGSHRAPGDGLVVDRRDLFPDTVGRLAAPDRGHTGNVNEPRHRSVFHLPGMDCPTEENLVRLALNRHPDLTVRQVNAARGMVVISHAGSPEAALEALSPLGMGARLVSTDPEADVDPAPHDGQADESPERGTLWVVLGINATMFVVELVAGLLAQSSGLIADSLDMLADAAVYGIALAAVGGSLAAQRRSARISGLLQLALACLVLVDVVRRAVAGSEPVSGAMMAVGLLALAANLTSLALLSRHRRGGVHLRASWIFSTNDVIANLGVILAGVVVSLTGSAWPDLVIGTLVALLVASGGWRILRMTRSTAPEELHD